MTLQNPFQFLSRDCDVESMSDGWDNATAYGEGSLRASHRNQPQRSLWLALHSVCALKPC